MNESTIREASSQSTSTADLSSSVVPASSAVIFHLLYVFLLHSYDFDQVFLSSGYLGLVLADVHGGVLLHFPVLG